MNPKLYERLEKIFVALAEGWISPRMAQKCIEYAIRNT